MLLKPCMYILFVNFENKEGEVVEIKIESLGGWMIRCRLEGGGWKVWKNT